MIRRLLFGLMWGALFWVGMTVIGGGIAGATAGANSAPRGATFGQGFDSGYDAGAVAGLRFRERYGRLLFAGAAILAAAGTVTGVLPGTRKIP